MRSLACLGVLCLVQSLDFSSRAGIKFSVIGQWSTTSTKCGLVIVPDLHGEGVVLTSSRSEGRSGESAFHHEGEARGMEGRFS